LGITGIIYLISSLYLTPRSLSSETKCLQFEASPLIGEITMACTLGYQYFRYADEDWRVGRPALTAWFEAIMQRESLQQTIPG
jgi:glutathione S-transferase